MAFEAIAGGKSGLMTAISSGCFAMVNIPDPKLGPRHVEVETMYDTDLYRPNYKNKQGLPVFLSRAGPWPAPH